MKAELLSSELLQQPPHRGGTEILQLSGQLKWSCRSLDEDWAGRDGLCLAQLGKKLAAGARNIEAGEHGEVEAHRCGHSRE